MRPEHIMKMLQQTADDYDRSLLDVEYTPLEVRERADFFAACASG